MRTKGAINKYKINGDLHCAYGVLGYPCRYWGNPFLCNSREAAKADAKGQVEFFAHKLTKCQGYLNRAPLDLTPNERRDFWREHGPNMLAKIYRDRAEIRQTLAAHPELVCDDCPPYLLPAKAER